jgi:Na+-driven multidrug efflux pump
MTNDMTKGSPLKIFILFSIPLLIGNIFQQLYSMVDTIIVGRFVGVDALAAVGSKSTVTTTVNKYYWANSK